MIKPLKTTSQQGAPVILGCVSHQAVGRALPSQCHLTGFPSQRAPFATRSEQPPPCLCAATSQEDPSSHGAPQARTGSVLRPSQAGREKPLVPELEQGNPSCGFPTFLVALAPQPKQNQHFPFFFNSLFSSRPNRRRGSCTALSQSCFGWKAATPTSSRVPAAPCPQQPLGEQGMWGDTVG